eukprot:5300939-Alexandrium_andersonii.AAC.1
MQTLAIPHFQSWASTRRGDQRAAISSLFAGASLLEASDPLNDQGMLSPLRFGHLLDFLRRHATPQSLGADQAVKRDLAQLLR